jgi:hypothetical protein
LPELPVEQAPRRRPARRPRRDDNALLLTQLAVRPLAQPAFPLEHLGRL